MAFELPPLPYAFDALEPDSILLMRVFRDGGHVNDTFPDAVFGFNVALYYQGDRQFTPFKAPDFYGK